MKTHSTLFLAAAGCAMLFTAATALADAKDYQVTGPVTAVTDKVITVQKGKDLWELNRDASTKVTGGSEIKVGDKVTVHYTMLASTVEDKGAAPATKAAGPKKGKAAAAAPAAAATPAKP